MENKTLIICKTISGIVTTLVVGELFGGIVSRPIAAWRLKHVVNDRVIESLDQRITDLENKNEDEA